MIEGFQNVLIGMFGYLRGEAGRELAFEWSYAIFATAMAFMVVFIVIASYKINVLRRFSKSLKGTPSTPDEFKGNGISSIDKYFERKSYKSMKLRLVRSLIGAFELNIGYPIFTDRNSTGQKWP